MLGEKVRGAGGIPVHRKVVWLGLCAGHSNYFTNHDFVVLCVYGHYNAGTGLGL